jgi:hypothetical protein
VLSSRDGSSVVTVTVTGESDCKRDWMSKCESVLPELHVSGKPASNVVTESAIEFESIEIISCVAGDRFP